LFYKNSDKFLILSLNDEYQSLIEEEKETHRLIKLKVLSKLNDFKNSYLNTQAVEKELSAAKLALNGIKKEEEFGIRTLLDVLDNEVKVTNAELNLISSKANQVLQKYELKKVVGTLTIEDMIDNYKIKKVEGNNFVLPSVFDIDLK
jgi:outer membrane protein